MQMPPQIGVCRGMGVWELFQHSQFQIEYCPKLFICKKSEEHFPRMCRTHRQCEARKRPIALLSKWFNINYVHQTATLSTLFASHPKSFLHFCWNFRRPVQWLRSETRSDQNKLEFISSRSTRFIGGKL